MRIKFNDKIYRLKEIESGVDSLMELVEEPKYKHGDFLMTRYRLAFIFDREGENGEAHHLFCTDMDGSIKDNAQDRWRWIRHCGYLKDAIAADHKAIRAIHDGLKSIGKRWNAEKKCIEDIPVYKDGDFVYEDGRIMIVKSYPNFHHANAWHTHSDKISYNGTYAANFSEPTFRYATAEEKQELIELLRKDGKRWNAEKKCIEDIPKRKFKAGDKVKINPGLTYYSPFYEHIGKGLIVIDYTESGNVKCNNGLRFAEDWLEPCSDEPKVGDMVIAWNNDMSLAVIGIKIDANPAQGCKHVLNNNNSYKHAIKFDGTRDHIEKIRSGKV